MFLFSYFFIEVELIYNVVLVSDVQQSGPVIIYIYIHSRLFFQILFPYRPLWKIPWTEEPGRLHSMGSLRVGHD